MKKTKPTFTSALNHISGTSPVTQSVLQGLSLMTRPDLETFKTVWPSLGNRRRLEVITKLVETAEQSFEVNFDPVFIFALSDEDADVQATAINGLWENESPALVPPLIHLLKTGKTVKVRGAAASALGYFIYLGELDETDNNAVMLAEQALLSTIRQPQEEIEVIRRAIESISFSSQEGIEQIIENAYNHDDERMQISAIFAMGRSCNKRWAQIVIDELQNDTIEIRFEAARACGEIELPEALDDLILLLEQETDLDVIHNAIWSLGQIGGKKAQEVLEELAESDDESIADAANEALEELSLFNSHLNDLLNVELTEFALDDPSDEEENEETPDEDYTTFNLN